MWAAAPASNARPSARPRRIRVRARCSGPWVSARPRPWPSAPPSTLRATRAALAAAAAAAWTNDAPTRLAGGGLVLAGGTGLSVRRIALATRPTNNKHQTYCLGPVESLSYCSRGRRMWRNTAESMPGFVELLSHFDQIIDETRGVLH